MKKYMQYAQISYALQDLPSAKLIFEFTYLAEKNKCFICWTCRQVKICINILSKLHHYELTILLEWLIKKWICESICENLYKCLSVISREHEECLLKSYTHSIDQVWRSCHLDTIDLNQTYKQMKTHLWQLV